MRTFLNFNNSNSELWNLLNINNYKNNNNSENYFNGNKNLKYFNTSIF